jgi:hypothetical protein
MGVNENVDAIRRLADRLPRHILTTRWSTSVKMLRDKRVVVVEVFPGKTAVDTRRVIFEDDYDDFPSDALIGQMILLLS